MAEENNQNFKVVEKKWQKWWNEHPELYKADDNDKRKKMYVLVEFPYPSGSGLHIGHAFTFMGGDVYARFRRMQGYNVCFPMGWDAFGLPTENYAIKTKQKPQKVTADNTAMFKKQMKELAFSFDWSRELNTTDSDYYRWTQWIFIKLFEKGLAFKQEMPINWCPSCKIGLANEEVLPAGRQESSGKCERCGTAVERRNISQWVVKITEYADKLIEGLERTNFVEKVKSSQINWIGKSEGARVKFKILNSKFKIDELEVFTTRPDTLYGATFIVVAPEHELVSQILNPSSSSPLDRGEGKNSPALSREGVGEGFKKDIEAYVKNARKKSDLERLEINKEKTGVFSGLYATNPMTGKEIPIWISDFVLASYGTGAIMSVPAHDERDFAFAKKFGLPIIPVIMPSEDFSFDEHPYTDVNSGKMVNSPQWEGLSPDEAIKKAIGYLKEKGIGQGASSYHLRDWIFSRQHYWGEPIPMIFCPACAKATAGKPNSGWVTVPEDQLPVVLPEVEAYEPTDDGQSPLSKIDSFVKITCPKCGGEARRETDTMPNWAGSDWYYLGYLINSKLKIQNSIPKGISQSSKLKNDNIFSECEEEIKNWMPVDVYIGGDEHNTLHLLYSRFIFKFLFDLGVIPIDEPYQKRMSHGVILGPDGQRMSKSKGNVVVPEEVSRKYGVDVTRCYLMFMGPYDGTIAWNEETLMGVKRFLDRFHNYIKQIKVVSASNQNILTLANKTISGVTKDLENFKYNTAIAKMMEMLNSLTIEKEIGIKELKQMISLLAPFAPYLTEELWSELRKDDDTNSIHEVAWPVADEKYLVEDTISLSVAVNGKVRDQISIPNKQSQTSEEVIKLAKESEKVKKWIEGKKIVREVYIKGKMINFVIGG